MKNIFTKTLTLIAFLSLSAGVWGADIPTELTFKFTESLKNAEGNLINTTTYELGTDNNKKEPSDGDFYWSAEIETNVRGKQKKETYTFTSGALARSKSAYYFQAGTYTMKLNFFSEENGQTMDSPTIKITTIGSSPSGYTATPDNETVSITDKDHIPEVIITYTVSITQAGDYYVVADFPKSEKIGFEKLYEITGSAPACENPTITTHPSGATYSQGATATALSVVASGTSLTYQWQESSNNSNWSNITNQTSTSYTPSTSATGTKYYRCVVTESGDCSTNSNSATITVNAATNFTAGQTLFFRSNGEGAWKDNACVIAEYSNNWNNKQTADLYWMYNVGNTDYKMFYGIVPDGTYDRVQLHRYAANKCYSTTQGDYWNDAGWVSVDGSKNTFYSKGAGGSDGEWYSTNYEMYLKGSINWTPNLATFTDQLNGDFAASYNNFQPSATSYEFRVYDNNDQGFGDGNTTLSGLNTNSTYNITASFNIGTRGTLNLVKTFVKGKVIFDANGKGTAPSALDNVPAGAKIAEPEMAEVDHYYVEGWYKESSCTNKWNFATDEVTESMTLYAKWVAVPQYTITASSSSEKKGSVTGGGTYYEGAMVTLTATPTTGNEFVSWSDGNTENPRVFTATENLTLTATFQKVCNKLMIECETYKSTPEPTKGTKWPSGAQITNDYYTKWTGTGYVDFKGNNGEIYFPVHLLAANYTFEFTIRNGGNRYFNLYQKSNGSGELTIDGVNYAKINGGEKLNNAEWDGNSGDPFVTETKTRNNVTEDDYVIGLYGEGYASFDHILITASSDVFCPATWSVYGNFDGNWKDYEMTDGVVTIPNLSRNTNYQFKLRKTSDEGENYTYYGAQNQENNMTSSNCTNWTLTNTNNGYDINITTGATGSYTFTATDLTGDSPKLSVTYPTAYSITFNDNYADGGTAMTNITNIASGGSETLPTMTRTKAGYRFTGWKDASGNDYADGATIENITSNITLTAQWETVVTVVTVTAEGGVKEITEGNTLQMSVAYTPADAAYGRSVTWSSSNTNLATISNKGLVSALQPGSVTITATSLNGVQGNYNLTIVASACGEGVWKMTYWPEGSGNKSEYCFTQIGETHEWRRDYTLPSVADWFSIGQVGGANDHSKDWTFNALTTIGLQSNKDATKYYPGQDAVGYLRIFDNSTNDNYYVAFEPIYQALFGIENGSDPWTVLDFEKVANTDHEYETSTFQVPAGYKNNDNYKYYVGTKRANGTSQFVSGKSNSDKLNTVGGLNSSDMSGKYGKFHIWGNSSANNWYCEFIRYYRLAYSGEGTEGYNPHDVLSTGSSSDRTVILGNVPAKTGYNISGWTIGSTLYTQGASYTLTDDATAIATWTPIVYHITYNNVEGATNTNPETYTIEDEIVLKDASRTGYDFAGWYLDGEFEHSITQISVGTHEDKTLYAKWTPTEYSITYNNLEGATNPNPTTYTIESEAITLENPGTRTHYTFNGWFSDDQFETPVTTIAQGSTGNKVLYAKWTEDSKYIITFDATTNGGTCATASKDIYVGEAVGTLPEATRNDYNMTGWFDAATGGNQITESTIPTGNVTYYAQFAVAPLVECTNHRKLECEDAMIPYDNLTIVNTSVAGPETATPGNNNDRGEYSGRGYMLTVNGSDGSEIYIPLSISGEEQAALTMQIRYANSQHDYSKIRIYKETQESGDIQVTNTGKYYSRISSEEFASSGWTTNFATANYNKTLDPGNYIIGLWAKNDARFDYIDISTTNDVLCTTTPRYELKLEIDNPTMGENATDAGAYTEGASVPINVTAKSGYEFVAWKKGKTLVSTEASFNYTMPAENVTLTAYFDTKATKRTLTASVADGQSYWGHVDQTSQQVGEGRPAQVTAIVDNNRYRFDHWSSTDVDLTELQAKANPLQFTMPTKDVAVVAHFVFDTVHNMIATGTSTNVGTHIDRHSNQDRITITSITDNTGSFQHNVLQYAINFQSTSDYSAYTVPTDANYSANAKATGYAFWYMADDNIYMEFNIGGDHGIVCKLPSTNGVWKYFYVADATAATATSGFEIWMNYSKDSWGMSSLTGTVYFSEIQATNVTEMSPIVPKVNLTVTKNPDEGGNVTTSPAEITNLEKGTQVTLTASPNTGYRFVNWTVNDVEVSTDAEYNYIVNANTTITANFERVYTLVVNYDEHIASVTGAGQYAEGESVTVTATAAQGYKFTKWTEDNASGEDLATTSSYTFDMPATDNYTVYANSEQDITYYRITLGTCTNGSISAKMNDQEYTGAEVTANTPIVLTATPDEGYGFVQWIDGSRENPHTILANSETQARNPWTATFAQQFTVTATYGQPGTSVTGGGEYPTGAEVTLTANWTLASQDFTYGFKEWTDVTGINLSDEQKVSNPLTFTMPFANVSMKATFAPVECVDNLTIQCEDGQAYIPYNKQGIDLTTYPNEIPHVNGCGLYSDYYTEYHGVGYYDFKTATNSEMYYPVELPASTYKFEMWSAANDDKNCWMNLYIESDDANPDVVYKEVSYKKTNSVKANNHGSGSWPFKISGTIEDIVISSPKSVIIGLYCGSDYGAFDQIKITATDAVFCEEKDIETFTILSTESKEIPVSGVKNLVIYEGGQATNEDDVEVFETVKYIRSITEANIDKWSTFAVPCTATKTQVSKGGDVDDIYPVYRSTSTGRGQDGYYYMEVLTNNNPEAIGIESRARWDMSYTQQPQKDSAYITMFPRNQSDGYFIGSEIFYIGDYKSSGGVTLTGSKNAFIENGGWPEVGKPKYYYFPNSAITAIQPYDAYVLSEDGTMFVLTDQPTILPFQCYIQATTEFKELYPRLVIRQDSGGTTDLIPIRADEWNVSGVDKVMIDEVIYVVRDGKIYTVMGQLVK